MRILAVNYPKQEKDERKINFFVEMYQKKLKSYIQLESDQLQLPVPDLNGLEKRNPGICKEVSMILYRNKLGVLRDPMQSKAKII